MLLFCLFRSNYFRQPKQVLNKIKSRNKNRRSNLKYHVDVTCRTFGMAHKKKLVRVKEVTTQCGEHGLFCCCCCHITCSNDGRHLTVVQIVYFIRTRERVWRHSFFVWIKSVKESSPFTQFHLQVNFSVSFIVRTRKHITWIWIDISKWINWILTIHAYHRPFRSSVSFDCQRK